MLLPQPEDELAQQVGITGRARGELAQARTGLGTEDVGDRGRHGRVVVQVDTVSGA